MRYEKCFFMFFRYNNEFDLKYWSWSWNWDFRTFDKSWISLHISNKVLYFSKLNSNSRISVIKEQKRQKRNWDNSPKLIYHSYHKSKSKNKYSFKELNYTFLRWLKPKHFLNCWWVPYKTSKGNDKRSMSIRRRCFCPFILMTLFGHGWTYWTS